MAPDAGSDSNHFRPEQFNRSHSLTCSEAMGRVAGVPIREIGTVRDLKTTTTNGTNQSGSQMMASIHSSAFRHCCFPFEDFQRNGPIAPIAWPVARGRATLPMSFWPCNTPRADGFYRDSRARLSFRTDSGRGCRPATGMLGKPCRSTLGFRRRM